MTSRPVKTDAVNLASALVLFAIGFSIVYFTLGNISPIAVSYGIIFITLFAVAHLLRDRILPHGNPYLLPLAAALTGLGLIEIFRIKPSLALTQSIWVFLGLGLYLLTVWKLKKYSEIASYKYICGILGIVFLLSSIVFGREVNGAKLWISVMGLSFQPSEISKILLIVFFAGYLSEKREMLSTGLRRLELPSMKHLGPLLLMWFASLLLLIFQKDLGTSLLFFGTFVVLLYIATGKEIYTIIGAVLFSAGTFACYEIFPHIRVRFEIWLNPWRSITGSGYQIVQSLFAIASGGLFGRGLGQGAFIVGKKLLLPAASTDFIFSALSEELGFIGSAGIVALYIFWVYRAFKIASTSEDEFGKLLAAGIATTIAIQSFVIIGGVTKLIPITGITLPLVSYGGSSIISNFVLIGLLEVISSQGKVKREKGAGAGFE